MLQMAARTVERLPSGVPKLTYEFLCQIAKRISQARQQGEEDTKLDARRRNLIGIYYGTDASYKDLIPIAKITSRVDVRWLIFSGLKLLREELPPKLQKKYPLQEILVGKPLGPPKGYISERLRRLRREALSQIMHLKWQDRDYKAVTAVAFEKGRAVALTMWDDDCFRARMSEINRQKVLAMWAKRRVMKNNLNPTQ